MVLPGIKFPFIFYKNKRAIATITGGSCEAMNACSWNRNPKIKQPAKEFLAG
jgi:hypothetical protein